MVRALATPEPFNLGSSFILFAGGPCIERAVNSKFDSVNTESENACATVSDAMKEYATKTNPNWAKTYSATILDNMVCYYNADEVLFVA